jgi:hypothetical protein
LVEYGMLVGLIAVICVVAVTTLGAEVSTAFSGGRWIRTLGPRVMDDDLGRQVPALIAVFELAGTAVPLQRGTKVIRPDRHPEFP